MVLVIPALTPMEVATVIDSMQGYGRLNDKDVIGFWENGVCIGGAAISDIDHNLFTYAINTKSRFSLGYILHQVFMYLLPKYDTLTGRINKTNFKSIAIAAKVGYRKVYETDTEIVYVFAKSLWKYQQRWPL